MIFGIKICHKMPKTLTVPMAVEGFGCFKEKKGCSDAMQRTGTELMLVFPFLVMS
jgi:hypothetical protein